MTALKTKLIFGYVAAGCLVTGAAFASPTNIEMNGSTIVPPPATVRTEITDFANKYGVPVILHGTLNLDAPIAVADNQSVTSDQAITVLSQAAGGTAERVYFVTPASGSNITHSSAIESLVGDAGTASFNLRAVESQAAIRAVAQADNAEVRFPKGVPSGRITLRGSSIPVTDAISRIAMLTKTHWSLGYIIQSQNTYLQPLPQVATASNPRETAEMSTGTSGDSTVGGPVAHLSSAAAATDNQYLAPIQLPRDSAGNVRGFTVHFPAWPPASSVTTAAAGQGTQTAAERAQQFAAQQQQQESSYNSQNVDIAPLSEYDSISQSSPDGGGNTGFSSVQSFSNATFSPMVPVYGF